MVTGGGPVGMVDGGLMGGQPGAMRGGCFPCGLALRQEMKNNPMHSRRAIARRCEVRAARSLQRRANRRQTGRDRGICGAGSFSRSACRQSVAI